MSSVEQQKEETTSHPKKEEEEKKLPEDDEECWEECEEGEEEEEKAFEEEEEEEEQQAEEIFLTGYEQASIKAKKVAKIQQDLIIKLFTRSRIHTEEFKQEFPQIIKNDDDSEQEQEKPLENDEEEEIALSGSGILSLGPFFFMILYLLMAPYTKVEESFNVQAMHDFIFGGGCKVYASPSSSISNETFDVQGGVPLPVIENFYDFFSSSSSSSENSRISCQKGLSNFDHHNFPGVVPRSSVGALAIATVAAVPVRFASFILPYIKPLIFIGMEPEDIMIPMLTDAMLALMICRFILGSAVVLSIIFLADSLDEFVFEKTRELNKGIKNVFNKMRENDDESNGTPFYPSAALCIIVACTQFHTLYYASRPLPNTFATIGVNLAFGCMLRRMPKLAIFFLSFTTCIFRFDIAVLALPVCLMMWLRGDIGLISGVATGLLSMTTSALAVLPLDSAFWTFAADFKNFKWTWPEFVVLYFNTAENKSSEWGVSPFHWYFTSALPRGIAGGLVLLFLAFISLFVWNRKTTPERLAKTTTTNKGKPETAENHIYWGVGSDLFLRTTLPSLFFIIMYSFLPHKELRFILPCFSALVLPAAYYLSQIVCLPSILRNAGPVSKLTTWIILLSFVASLGLMTLMVNMNKETYPGGKALEYVNQKIIDQRAWYLAVKERQEMKRRMKKEDDLEKLEKLPFDTSKQSFTVFIDAFAGMTGVSRFGKLRTIDFVANNNNDDEEIDKVSVNYMKNEQIFNLSDVENVKNSELYGNGIKFDFLIVRAEDTEWHVKERKCGGCRRNLILSDQQRLNNNMQGCCCSVIKSFPMMKRFNIVGFLLRGEKLIEWTPYIDVIGFTGSECYLP